MLKSRAKIISIVLGLAILLSTLSLVSASASQSTGSKITDADGWFESAYAEWAPISNADSYNAYISTVNNISWKQIDSALIRRYSDGYRVDAVGLKPGNYQIKIVPVFGGAEKNESALITSTLAVLAYDRSGYAHFNYSDGVGAYNDDGTLKDSAIVLYVTEENKNTVSVTSKDGTKVTGIGNILNSVGMDTGNGTTSKGGIANTNSNILRKLAMDGTPLVVRIIGNVSAPAGLTAFNSVDYGGSVGDNGFMARMRGGKDITIEGIGSDAVINGWGLHFICQSADYANGLGNSFEVRNVTFKNVPEDCIGMEGQQESNVLTAPVERCWIHNCSFYAPLIANPAESDKSGGDGACDFKRGRYFTNSYCYYYGYHKTNLVGSSDDSLQYHLTYHHNYWKNCESRGPLARQANIHMYNNIFDSQTSYCMNPRADAYIFSEYNMFYKCKNPVDVDSGAVKSYNDSFTSCTENNHATIVSDRSTKVSSNNKFGDFDTNSSLSYIPSGDYIIQESISDMRAVVLAYAGTQKENIVKPEEVNASVIPKEQYPTAAVILDYNNTLNKSSIPSSGTYDNIVFNISKSHTDYIGVGGSATECNIVFYVDTAVNITITQTADSSFDSVLCDAYGRCLLVGGGTVENLPSGYYFIQSGAFDVGSGKYKEAKISALTIVAVDPNASTNPIPTPPDGGGEGGSDDNGSSDDNGENDTVITNGAEVHSFTDDGLTDPEDFFSISGNTSTSKGSTVFNDETLSTCLKMESATKITFNADKRGTLVLVFGGSTNASGKAVKIDGKSQSIPESQVLEISLDTGSHTITKGDSINLFYIAFIPEATTEHTHSYNCEARLDPTCTESGAVLYTCDCGDSYTVEIEPLGHSYEKTVNAPTCTGSGYTTYTCSCGHTYTADETAALGHSYEAEVTDPTCTDSGYTTYTCSCGHTYTADETAALGHDYTDGKCVCGAEDPNYVPPVDDTPDDNDKEDVTDEDGKDDTTSSPDDSDKETETDDESGKNDTSADDSESDTSDDQEEKPGFFARLWRAIANFFRRLFGKKD